MWEELDARQQALLACLGEHQRVCASGPPERSRLANSRWQVARRSRDRLEYLVAVALPVAERACVGSEHERVGRLRANTSEYRARISAFVSRWPNDRILLEWAGYCQEASELRSIVKQRISLETELLRPILRRRELIDGMPVDARRG